MDKDANLIPVPIRLLNYRSNGIYVNQLSTYPTEAQLTRRVFTLDTVSTLSSSGGQPSIVRFPEEVNLNIPIDANLATLKLPTLEIKYAERAMSSLSASDASQVSTPKLAFQVTYTSSTEQSQTGIITAFILFSVLAGIVWAAYCSSWTRSNYLITEPVSLEVRACNS
jgi:hypothetical protein